MKNIFSLSVLLLWHTIATAGSMGAANTSKTLQPLASFQGGYACINASKKSQVYTGTDSNLFTYAPSGSSCDAGFYGVFIGGERFLRDVSSHPVFLQAGIEYNNFDKIKISGINTVGVDSSSSTEYSYQFNTKIQQVLAGIKLLSTTKERFHPYGEAGLGIAFNRTGDYLTSTTNTGSLNFTPEFVGGKDMKISFILGLGLDANIYEHIRVGLGYRYSYFNTASLGNGSVNLGGSSSSTSQIPVSFNPEASHLYANQLLGHITYIA